MAGQDLKAQLYLNLRSLCAPIIQTPGLNIYFPCVRLQLYALSGYLNRGRNQKQ